MCDPGGIVSDVVNSVVDTVAAPVEGLATGNIPEFIEGVAAPSLIGAQEPGIVGDAFQLANTAVGGFFGGPAGAFGAGALNAGVNGADIGGALESGAISGATTGAVQGLGAALSPGGLSAGAAGSIGDVTGSGTPFTLPETLGGAPDLASSIGTGASDGASIGTSTFQSPTIGGGVSGALAPAEAGPTGFPPGGGAASSGLEGAAGAAGDAGAGLAIPGINPIGEGAQAELLSPNPAATAAANQPGSSSFADVIGRLTGSPAAPGGPSASVPGQTSIDRFIDNPSLGTAGKALGANANILLPAAALGYQALSQPSLPNPSTITGAQQGTAGNLTSQGQSLLNSLNTGQLPAGAQQTLDQATASAKARIRSQYAGMGLSGSTMETQALNQVDQQAEAQKFQMIQDLVKTGITETQLGDQIYDSLLKSTLAQDQALSNSISRFAAASAGGSRPLVVAGG